ncbi:MAG: hypothetical protein KDC83_13300, partial [Flavobacteriales bacterium]|nr:hypothetical protein [Flavobacteriales bacterium]
DSKGNIINYVEFSKKGKEKVNDKFEYNTNGKLLKSEWGRHGKTRRSHVYTYDLNEHLVRREDLNSKGKTSVFNLWNYNEGGCLLSFEMRKGKQQKLRRKWVHTYYNGCDRKSSTAYNGSGKVLQTWSYDCKSEGEKLNPKKNETQICRWESVSQEYLIKVYQTFDENGRIIRTVSKYSIQDTLPLEQKEYNEKDELLRHFVCDKSYDKPLMSGSYRHGKEMYRYDYQYDGETMISWTHSWHGKIRSTIKLDYNRQGNLVLHKWTKRKGKLRWMGLVELAYQ